MERRSDQDQNGEFRSLIGGALPSTAVVGGDLNAHVGFSRHPEREAVDLEREVMAGCGEYHQVEANYNGERLAKHRL